MTYSSDDHTSSSFQAPFTGDQTGDIFQSEDNFVAQSPVTTLRMVETQSGFLVVLKDVDERVSLSVKRKIGTPPASQVLLTGDESLKLSRILTSGKGALSAATSYTPLSTPEVPDHLPAEYQVSSKLERTPTADEAIQALTVDTHQTSDFSDLQVPETRRRARADMASPRREKEKKILIFGGVAVAVTIVGSIIAGAFLFFNYSSSTPPDVAKEITRNEMSSENVDTFVRTYVSNLLDFSPRSYQYSQIQAMAVMKPELMKKYWNETSFPLSRKQLTRLPQNQTVMISKVVQEPTSSVSTDVDLYAELTTPESKEPSPIHLRLGISLNQDGKLMVNTQKDVSHADKDAAERQE